MYLFYLGGNDAKFGHVREIEAIVGVLRLVRFAAKDTLEYLLNKKTKRNERRPNRATLNGTGTPQC